MYSLTSKTCDKLYFDLGFEVIMAVSKEHS